MPELRDGVHRGRSAAARDRAGTVAIKTPETAIPDMSLDPNRAKRSARTNPSLTLRMLRSHARRRAKPVRPKAPSSYKMPILFAVLGGLVLIGGFIAYTTRSRPIAMPNLKNMGGAGQVRQ